jgi:hypothetical protein
LAFCASIPPAGQKIKSGKEAAREARYLGRARWLGRTFDCGNICYQKRAKAELKILRLAAKRCLGAASKSGWSGDAAGKRLGESFAAGRDHAALGDETRDKPGGGHVEGVIEGLAS